MDICGYLWIFVDICGYLWIFLDLDGDIIMWRTGPVEDTRGSL